MKAREKEILLVTGGCRSGKSRFAQKWAEGQGHNPLFLATARILDQEMAERVRRHQAARGPHWKTVEEPLNVAQVIGEQGDRVEVALVDCVTLWVNNLLMEGLSDKHILRRVRELSTSLNRISCSVGLVTNEVGWGIVPDHPLGRRFRDLIGTINQELARAADQVVLVVSGIPLTLKCRGEGSPGDPVFVHPIPY